MQRDYTGCPGSRKQQWPSGAVLSGGSCRNLWRENGSFMPKKHPEAGSVPRRILVSIPHSLWEPEVLGASATSCSVEAGDFHAAKRSHLYTSSLFSNKISLGWLYISFLFLLETGSHASQADLNLAEQGWRMTMNLWLFLPPPLEG